MSINVKPDWNWSNFLAPIRFPGPPPPVGRCKKVWSVRACLPSPSLSRRGAAPPLAGPRAARAASLLNRFIELHFLLEAKRRAGGPPGCSSPAKHKPIRYSEVSVLSWSSIMADSSQFWMFVWETDFKFRVRSRLSAKVVFLFAGTTATTNSVDRGTGQ